MEPGRETWISREESFVFSPEPEPTAETPETKPAGRITLPSSGLASDILARPEAAAIEPAAAAGPLVPATHETVADSSSDVITRAHNFSFFATPAREERKAAEASEHLVTFFLAREEYGVDVRLVQEIIRVSAITQVPRAPAFIKGVINLRGRIIPVIDLKHRLGLGEVEPGRQARVVVIHARDRLIGLLVDGASQVLKVPVSTIEAAPEEVTEIDSNYIRGVAKLETRLIILVDLMKILGFELREAGALAPRP